jgi:tRNA threonylcarbamoyladenosine modification (KEOPS) complex  Pcc1 subunit
MTEEPRAWLATVTVRARDRALARSLERALRPEARREVPRARAELLAPTGEQFALEITTSDIGAMRAALNTYLGWIQLASATVRVAESGHPGATDAPG